MTQRKDIFIHFCIGLVFGAFVMYLNWERELIWPHRLCDAFFVPGGLLLGLGVLKFVRNQGVFDMMSYGIKVTVATFLPFTQMNSPLDARQEEFVDYKERKKEERKNAAPVVWAGVIHLAISAVFYVIYLLLR